MIVLSRGLFQHAAPALPVPHKDDLNVSSAMFSMNEAECLSCALDMFVPFCLRWTLEKMLGPLRTLKLYVGGGGGGGSGDTKPGGKLGHLRRENEGGERWQKVVRSANWHQATGVGSKGDRDLGDGRLELHMWGWEKEWIAQSRALPQMRTGG